MKTKCLAFTAAVFAALGMIVGIVYHGMMLSTGTGGTAMAATHPMTFALGCGGFLIALVLEKLFAVSESKLAKPAYFVYIVGVAMTVIMLIVRGYFQMSGTELTSGADAAISGIAGIGHTVLAVGMALFFVALFRRIFAAEKSSDKGAE